MAARIRKGDEVILIAGKDKGKVAHVLRVFPQTQKILVEGVNRVKKTVKKSEDYPNGGLIEQEMPLHVSNVMLYCPKVKRGVRVEFFVSADGIKKRRAKGVDFIFSEGER